MLLDRRKYLWILGSLVAALFVAGIVWRALNPQTSENPDEEVQIASRQDGYYLCLHRPQLSPAEMYRLIKRRLPNDNLTYALRGCQEAQTR
jgi:hypothetical protein